MRTDDITMIVLYFTGLEEPRQGAQPHGAQQQQQQGGPGAPGTLTTRTSIRDALL